MSTHIKEALKTKWSKGDLIRLDRCPACGSEKRIIHAGNIKDAFSVELPDLWVHWRCKSCRSIYLDPRPDDASIPRAYEGDYYTHSVQTQEKRTDVFSVAIEKSINGYLNKKFSMNRGPSNDFLGIILGLLLPVRLKLNYFGRHLFGSEYPQRGKLLDVGCGNGEFLSRAKDMGWQAYGVDPDIDAVQTCERQGLNVVHGGARTLHAEFTESFDVVMLCHSLEHVAEPVTVLKDVIQLVRPGGRVWIALPNPSSLSGMFYKKFNIHLDPPRHLLLPSQQWLCNAVEELGLRDVTLLKRGIGSKFTRFESSRLIRRDGGSSEQWRIRISPLIAIFSDLLSTFFVKWADETVIAATKPIAD